jgi:hypothetical protein
MAEAERPLPPDVLARIRATVELGRNWYGLTYLAHLPGMPGRAVKIGRTQCLASRMPGLRSVFGRVELIGTIDNPDAERALLYLMPQYPLEIRGTGGTEVVVDCGQLIPTALGFGMVLTDYGREYCRKTGPA